MIEAPPTPPPSSSRVLFPILLVVTPTLFFSFIFGSINNTYACSNQTSTQVVLLLESDVASAASVARHPVPNTSPRLDQLASSAGRQKDGFDEGREIFDFAEIGCKPLLQEITTSYYELAQKHHPDHGGDQGIRGFTFADVLLLLLS